MALEIIKNINVDFHDTKYIIVNAKQYDDSSRYIAITCYNQGNIFNLSAKTHSAYVKYKKADGHAVLNFCKINYKGEVLVELTEQMLAAIGMCYVDLIIINKGSAMVNIDTGEIIAIDNTPILSTMAFCVNVHQTIVDNSYFESSYEYDALNDLLQRAEADYKEVIMLSKSYAVGDAGEIRDGEDADNSKYYSRLSRSYAIGDADNIRDGEDTDNSKYYSEQSAKSADAAKNSEENAESYMNTTNEYMTTTDGYMKSTESYMNNTESYKNTTKEYMDNAEKSEANSKTSEDNAKASELNAKTSEENAKKSEEVLLESANLSQSYAVGGTNTRDGEDTDNAHYYYNMVKAVANGLNSGFIPIGTITFAELATAEKVIGYTYNISDDFVTDDTFAEGAGMSYTAGTNVYCRFDGYWDCFGGTTSPTATIDEVKEYLGA